jgi:predicted DNA-binding transcriptional regulator AlpA
MTARFTTVRKFAPHVDMTEDQIYRAIREGKFPFPFVRIGKLIRIDTAAIGLVPEQGDENDEAQEQDQRLATAA